MDSTRLSIQSSRLEIERSDVHIRESRLAIERSFRALALLDTIIDPTALPAGAAILRPPVKPVI